MGSVPDIAAFFLLVEFCHGILFFNIEPQKRSRVTKLGAQTQHRVIQRFAPPSASKQSGIACARDKCVVFSNIGQAIFPAAISIFSERAASSVGEGWGGCASRLSILFLFYFPCSANHERDWPPFKVVFSGWQPIR